MALISLGPARFLQEAYLAITDFHFYRTIFEQPFRRTLLYLLYLSATVALVLTLTYAWQYGPQAREICRWAEQNFPPFQVKDGKLMVEAEQPLIKKYTGEQPITFVFDTSGTYTDPEILEEPAVLMTEEKIYVRFRGRTETLRWKDLGPIQAGGEELQRLKSFLTWAYFPVFYSVFLIRSLIVETIHGCLLILFGFLASARKGIWLKSSRYFTIALYSLTPAVTIDLAVTMTGLEGVHFPLVIYLGTAVLYTYLGTQKCLTVE